MQSQGQTLKPTGHTLPESCGNIWGDLGEGSLGVDPSPAEAPQGPAPAAGEWQGKGYRLTRKNNH